MTRPGHHGSPSHNSISGHGLPKPLIERIDGLRWCSGAEHEAGQGRTPASSCGGPIPLMMAEAVVGAPDNPALGATAVSRQVVQCVSPEAAERLTAHVERRDVTHAGVIDGMGSSS